MPPIYITDFSLLDEKVAVGGRNSPLRKSIICSDSIRLKHDQNSLSLQIAALSYREPQTSRLLYKLEGFDDQWRQCTPGSATITYSKIPYGKYSFRVRLPAGSDHAGPEAEKRLFIEVSPPFYLSAAAYVVYGLLALGALVLIRIYYTRRNVRRQQQHIQAFEREKERELYNAKISFFTNIAHEIRTPLNAIVGFSNLLIETEDPADKKEYVDIIQRNNEQLLQLISDILDLSKIEAGMVELSYTKIELNLLCQEVVSSYMADTEREVPIVFAGGCDDCYIISDRSKLVQVLSNLINNAIKFTQQGCITVGFRKLQKGIEFYVQDTGIGIVAENIQLIFNRFEKLNHFAHGTGLGLTICRNLVEKLDGTIGVESEPGIGSRFWFTVPYEPAGLHRAEDALLPPSHGLSQISPGKPVILVAEDTDSNFQVLSAILRNDYELLRARDGDEAVRLVEQYRFVAVLMDMKMPVMDGLEATRKIKAVNPTLPVIAVTAYAYDHDREKALQAGCNDYMTKPMDVTELKQKLSEFVKDKH